MKTPKNVKVVRLEDVVTFTPFDAAEYLDSEEMIAAYLNDAAATGDEELFLSAIADIARARSMTKLAKDSGLGRESLYKSLRPGAKPRFDTVNTIMRAMGLKLTVVPSKAATGIVFKGETVKVIGSAKRISHHRGSEGIGITERAAKSSVAATGADKKTVAKQHGYGVTYFARKHGITVEQTHKLIDKVGNDRTKLNKAAEKLKGAKSTALK